MSTTIVRSVLLFILLMHGAQSLSCFCRISTCKDLNLLKEQCKGGLVDDVCHCCKMCAKVEGETCGGLWGFEGTCDQGLICKGGHPWRMTKGICALKTETKPTRAIGKVSEESTEPPDEIEYSSGEDETELSTAAEKILTATESLYFGDESGDDSDNEDTKPTTRKWIWLPTLKSDPTVEREIPTSSNNENESTPPEKILTTTESSYSGDGSGDDEDDELPTEKRTSTTWAWLPTLKSEPTVHTTKETEIPTSSEHDENENSVIYI